MTPDPLLFLPGFMCDARLFWHQIAAFSTKRMVSVAPLLGESIEEMAENVLAAAPARFCLVGHWLGGVVAMEMLRRAPERIAQIALIDVSPLPETPQAAGLRELALFKVAGTGEKRVEALRLADIFRANVVDSTLESFVFEVTGTPEKIDAFAELMRPLGLIDVARTGVAALSRGV